MRARDIPRVLSPGIWSTFTVVTFDPSGFDVFPGFWRPEKKKSSAVVRFGSLQNFPFTKTADFGSLIATQMSWSGLGSDAKQREEAKAKRENIRTSFIVVDGVLQLGFFELLFACFEE